MGFALLAWLIAILVFAQGLFLIAMPERALRYTLWKTRLIGARVAAPGRGTILIYRIYGAAAITVSSFIVFKLLSE